MRVVAYSPSGLSSFFKACITKGDLVHTGAIGGGFLLRRGVRTEVLIERGKQSIDIYINGIKSKAVTSRRVIEKIMQISGKRCKVIVKHEIEVPVACGFGTSGAGALSLAMALDKALQLNMDVNKIGFIAHAAEIESKTGLGTIPPLLAGGGCVLTVKAGAPGEAKVISIPVDGRMKVVSVVIAKIYTRKILLSEEKLRKISKIGEETLKEILSELSVENFLSACKRFSLKSGLATSRVIKLMNEISRFNVLGVAQNMIGEGVHTVADAEEAEKIAKFLRHKYPEIEIIISEIHEEPARVIKIEKI